MKTRICYYSHGNYLFAKTYPGQFRSTSRRLADLAQRLADRRPALANSMTTLATAAQDPDTNRAPLIEAVEAHDLRGLTFWERDELAYLISRLANGFEFAQ